MSDIPKHSRVFVDTNILLYALTDHLRFGAWSNALLDRIHRGDLVGYVSAIVLNELIHLVILGVSAEIFLEARGLMRVHRLLSNDALHLAVMQKEGIRNLATNDADFDGIENIHVWKPREK